MRMGIGFEEDPSVESCEKYSITRYESAAQSPEK